MIDGDMSLMDAIDEPAIQIGMENLIQGTDEAEEEEESQIAS